MPKPKRRTLSCLPCRVHKQRCDKSVPCQTCLRYNRQDECHQNPPPGSRMTVHLKRQFSLVKPGVPVSNVVQPHRPLGDDSASRTKLVRNAEVTTRQTSPSIDNSNSSNSCPGARPSKFASPTAGQKEHTSVSQLAQNGRDVHGLASILDAPVNFWKRHLIQILPSRAVCDVLVSYYFENINWLFQTLHEPSFRQGYATFWTEDAAEIDLAWLALLYIMLSLSSLHIPHNVATTIGINPENSKAVAQRWYTASQQALHSSGCDSRPSLTGLQVFLVSQSYWIATRDPGILYSQLGKAVTQAQALELGKESPHDLGNYLEREMRHRIWWDLVATDTFQSISLGRPPLIQAHYHNVPFPSNCNDSDITPEYIKPRPLSEPTRMTMHHFRARFYKALNKLRIENGVHALDYTYVYGIDEEITAIFNDTPWENAKSSFRETDPPSCTGDVQSADFSIFCLQYHVINSCINTHRMRMYRPFLNPPIGDAWQRCLDSATLALSTYKALRSIDVASLRKSHQVALAKYQVFTAAVTLATYLLVERPDGPQALLIRSDVEMIIQDLLSKAEEDEYGRLEVPMVTDGRVALQRILALYDLRLQSKQDCATDGEDEKTAAVVSTLSSHLGGEAATRAYLDRYKNGHHINSCPPIGIDALTWDNLADISTWNQGEDWVDLQLTWDIMATA